ncbi:hypothetical protein BH11MYX3_BH11MYX3_35290 [soil metagenome]
MRSPIVVALVVALASACDSAGMEIVVNASADPGTPAPHTVKLFIGLGDGADAAIAPAPGTRRYSGVMHWDRDPANADDSTEYGDGPARFVFRPGGGIDKLSVVVAVGYDENGTPTSSAVLLGPAMGTAHVKVYSIGLNAFTDPTVKPNGYNGLLLWGPSSGQQRDESCVFVQNSYPEPQSTSAMITTPGDHDCDGLPDQGDRRECLPEVWNGKRTAMRSELSCLIQPPSVPILANACLLGGPACIDGIGPDTSCTASKYCTHPAICEPTLCGTGPGAWQCAEDVRSSAAGMVNAPLITCDVTVQRDATNVTMTVCSTSGSFDLEQIGVPAQATCSKAQVRNVMQSWSDRLVDLDAKFKVEVDDACLLTISGEGSYPSNGTQLRPLSGLLSVDLQASMHGMAFPIVFVPVVTTGQCAPPICHLNGTPSEAFTACISSPPPL